MGTILFFTRIRSMKQANTTTGQYDYLYGVNDVRFARSSVVRSHRDIDDSLNKTYTSQMLCLFLNDDFIRG